MKYKRDGRVYKLVWAYGNSDGSCAGCHIADYRDCPTGASRFACIEMGDGNDSKYIWRETIPSKIRGWLRSES